MASVDGLWMHDPGEGPCPMCRGDTYGIVTATVPGVIGELAVPCPRCTDGTNQEMGPGWTQAPPLTFWTLHPEAMLDQVLIDGRYTWRDLHACTTTCDDGSLCARPADQALLCHYHRRENAALISPPAPPTMTTITGTAA